MVDDRDPFSCDGAPGYSRCLRLRAVIAYVAFLSALMDMVRVGISLGHVGQLGGFHFGRLAVELLWLSPR